MAQNVQVLVNGNSIEEYYHRGDLFIEGRPGSEFSIKVINPTSSRIKAVVSVDGINIINGEPATEGGTGYVISPYGKEVFTGWRINNESVRKFVFAEKTQSYSNKTGKGTQNCGVIGVLLYKEKDVVRPRPDPFIRTDKPWTNKPWEYTNWNPYESSPTVDSLLDEIPVAMASTTSSMSTRSSNLGTDMGKQQYSSSYSTTFNEPDHAFSRTVIYYDDQKGLERRGIDVKRIHYKPDPFPASNDFCKEV